MNFKESELPGIGKKFTVQTNAEQYLSVVLLLNGKREVFLFDDPDDDPSFHFLLTEEEANLVGSILMGTYFKPEQDKQKELLLNKLSIEWVKISEVCLLANHSIYEQEIRKRTGITIISIIRENETLINPEPETMLKIGDTLVVVGSREQTKKFNELYRTTQ
jgi:TrkA domain protein